MINSIPYFNGVVCCHIRHQRCNTITWLMIPLVANHPAVLAIRAGSLIRSTTYASEFTVTSEPISSTYFTLATLDTGPWQIDDVL